MSKARAELPQPSKLPRRVALACLLTLCMIGIPGTANAASQHGCTFSVPKPSIKKGSASFKVTAECKASSASRTLDIELVADDANYDDAIQWTSKPVSKGGNVVTVSGWRCNEDTVGADEVYVRVRVSKLQRGTWRRGSFVTGAVTTGNCS